METNEEKFKSSVFFIEATHNEQHELWRQFNKETNWKQDLQGAMIYIGSIFDDERMPVYVTFSFIHIFGKRICFYEATSRFVDHQLVENWITKNYHVKWDNGTRNAMTDAQNFHLAIDRCKNEK